MRDLKHYIYKLKTTPIQKIFKQVIYKASLKTYQIWMRKIDVLFDSRTSFRKIYNLTPININIKSLDLSGISTDMADELMRMWIAHRFDLLGSGWVEVAFKDNAPGFMKHRYQALELTHDDAGLFLSKILSSSNLSSAKKIWHQISQGYQPIDWQKDYKSGYRWDARKWYRPQKTADLIGGDIKVPWELSRLQHLPRMAVFSLLSPDKSNVLFQEFCNQCLDFFAQNPPRMGVNWMCTMDVGIRTANLALAYSLFKNDGNKFSNQFNQIFSASMYDHCKHIRENLEWSEVLTSNHYLADIAGLLFGSAVLIELEQGKNWFDFARKEIINEIDKQFLNDGANFEGSSAYHRLSGEMAVYSVALIHSFSQRGMCEPVTQALLDKLLSAGNFTKCLTRPDGIITQIGDNDSGMFFRLTPTGGIISPDSSVDQYYNLENYKAFSEDYVYADEQPNDCRTFLSAVEGLFHTGDFTEESKLYPLEYSLVRNIIGGQPPKASLLKCNPTLSEPHEKFEYSNFHTIQAEVGTNLLRGLVRHDFPMFGVYVFRSESLFLVVNASDNGQNGNAGHAHNDKMSFELLINGRPIFEDAGTFVYTANAQERNSFRETKSHNTIYCGIEQNEFVSLFSMKNNTTCGVIEVSDEKIRLFARYSGVIHERSICIHQSQIIVEDRCTHQFKANFAQTSRTSGYGKLLR